MKKMAVVKCEVCGQGARTTAKNYVFINGIHQHKKCPAKADNKLTSEEIKDKKDLTDAIDWTIRKQGKAKLSPAQWSMVTSQIKKLKEQGYTYQDQLYAFKWYFDESKGNEYKGYGIVSYIIEEALQEKNEKAEINNVSNDEEALKKYMEQKRKERLGL